MRIVIFSLVFILLSIGFASAISADFLKSEYHKGDSVQIDVTIPGLVGKLKADNFELVYSGERVNVGLFFVEVSSENYFVYFTLPLQEGNYTFFVKNYQFIENEILKQETFSKSFSVFNESGVSVNPAIVDARKDIDLINLYIKNYGNETLDFSVSSDVDFIKIGDRFRNVSVGGGREIRLTYALVKNKINKERGDIIFLDYKIPVLVNFVAGKSIPSDAVRFIDERINVTILSQNYLDGDVAIKNFYSEPVYNVEFGLSKDLLEIVRIEPDFFDVIDPGEIRRVHVWVNENEAGKGDYEGNLSLTSGVVKDGFPIFVHVTEKEIEIPVNQSFVETNEPENGTIFKPVEPEKKSYGWIWAIVVLVLIFIAVLVFYFLRKKEKLENIGELAR